VISRDHMGGFGFEVKSGNMTPPLGLAYCAAVMERVGIEVEILDAVALGMKPGEVLGRVREQGYGLVAVNTATPSIADDLAMATSIKELLPQAFVALIGPHVSIFSEDALKESRADAVVRGEPEYSLGIADLDTEHKNLLNLLCKIHYSMTVESERENIDGLLARLAQANLVGRVGILAFVGRRVESGRILDLSGDESQHCDSLRGLRQTAGTCPAKLPSLPGTPANTPAKRR